MNRFPRMLLIIGIICTLAGCVRSFRWFDGDPRAQPAGTVCPTIEATVTIGINAEVK